MHLALHAVATDAGKTSVDHIGNAGHCNGCFSHIRGKYHLAPFQGQEYLLLLGWRQPGIERKYFGVAQFRLAQRHCHIPDFPLPAEEYQDVSQRWSLRLLHGFDLAQRIYDALNKGFFILILAQFDWAIQNIHRIGSPRHRDNGGIAKMGREFLYIDRCRRDDDFEVRSFDEQLGKVAENEINIEAALVRLVDNQHFILAEKAVLLNLG